MKEVKRRKEVIPVQGIRPIEIMHKQNVKVKKDKLILGGVK